MKSGSKISRVWVRFGFGYYFSGSGRVWVTISSKYPPRVTLRFCYNESFECLISGRVQVSVFGFGWGRVSDGFG